MLLRKPFKTGIDHQPGEVSLKKKYSVSEEEKRPDNRQ
jgi:hypothetical protein